MEWSTLRVMVHLIHVLGGHVIMDLIIVTMVKIICLPLTMLKIIGLLCLSIPVVMVLVKLTSAKVAGRAVEEVVGGEGGVEGVVGEEGEVEGVVGGESGVG